MGATASTSKGWYSSAIPVQGVETGEPWGSLANQPHLISERLPQKPQWMTVKE